MNFESYSNHRVPVINAYIEQTLKNFKKTVSHRFGGIIEAMEYSLHGGGKKIRPLLVMASADFVGIKAEKVLPAACAIEYIHTYSLIHDDLPPMDNDDFRRGLPSSHKKFGEAVAILTGDALLTEAFGMMLRLSDEEHFPPDRVLKAIELLVFHAGIRGMVGGQLLDVTTPPRSYSLPELEFNHIHKTGALILASVLIPAHLSMIEQTKLNNLKRYGESIGLAFQLSDDLLDYDIQGSHAKNPKKSFQPSYTEIMSISEMREKLNSLIDIAKNSISGEGDRSKPLLSIAEFILNRNH